MFKVLPQKICDNNSGRLDIYLPKTPGLEDEKLPDKKDFPRVIGVKPSNRIKKHKVKKGLKSNFILISDSCTFIHGT